MKTALITGTTSGIGKAFADKFADEGYDLILIARNEQKLKQQQAILQETYHVAVRYISQDLTQENATGLITEYIDKWKVTIDVKNNACQYYKQDYNIYDDATGNQKTFL